METTFFISTKRINFLNSKQSSDRLVIVVKGFLKLPNLHMLIKQKSQLLPGNLILRAFGKLLLVFSVKVSLLHLLDSSAQSCGFPHMIWSILQHSGGYLKHIMHIDSIWSREYSWKNCPS